MEPTTKDRMRQGLLEWDQTKSWLNFRKGLHPRRGRCLVTKRDFNLGEFVLEYEGDFIEKEEALRREELYREEHLGSFIVNATWKGRPVYIDGTLQFNSMGRLVNHARGGNLKPFRLLQVKPDQSPRLALFAARRIKAGDELFWNYNINAGDTEWASFRCPADPTFREDSSTESETDNFPEFGPLGQNKTLTSDGVEETSKPLEMEDLIASDFSRDNSFQTEDSDWPSFHYCDSYLRHEDSGTESDSDSVLQNFCQNVTLRAKHEKNTAALPRGRPAISSAWKPKSHSCSSPWVTCGQKSRFDADINFCPDCGSILPLPGVEHYVRCYTCPYKIDVAVFDGLETKTKVVFNKRKITKIKLLGDSIGPTVDSPCPRCSEEGMAYSTWQTLSADKGQTVFYHCTHCGLNAPEES